MRVHYSSDEDAILIQLSNKKVDHAIETDTMIVHVDQKNEPVLLEIFDAKTFFKAEADSLPKRIKEEYFASAG